MNEQEEELEVVFVKDGNCKENEAAEHKQLRDIRSDVVPMENEVSFTLTPEQEEVLRMSSEKRDSTGRRKVEG